ncbi:hypothetical protein [Candidatus Epulonipiscium viviparus]|uniref:hypothetical protein n=1 Tax=Candidatus Epulonipiscium viviparus TaxID=420336 RepID=UPI00016C01DD|nr:hypothetical protein [Candidatus Epulopiscium viviparus]
MRNFKLENYTQELNQQVIHMDQAVCYSPEFRATRMMHQYPSRMLQIARAIFKDEMPLSDYAGEIIFTSILSRQGERWQNFGECPENCTDVTILARAMLLEKGYKSPATAAFTATPLPTFIPWDLPVDTTSDTAILLDANTASVTSAAASFANYCNKTGLAFANKAEAEAIGFDYFAYGLVDLGTMHLQALVDKYNSLNVAKVLVLSAQTAYMLRTFVKKVGIEPNFEVVYLPEIIDAIDLSARTYVYAGSFNTRYLMNSELINNLTPAETNVQVRTSQEFIPLLEGNARANKITMWQKPIAAEYTLYGTAPAIVEAIKADAIRDIKEANAAEILVFEPTAYAILKDAFAECKVTYYLDAI